MGTITRGFANNINSSGILKPAAFNNDSFDNITSVPSGSLVTGGMVFIKKLTASSSATLSFVDGSDGVVLDDTYKEYVFTFNNIHGSTDDKDLTFQCSTDNGSTYGITLTSTHFRSYHEESDSLNGVSYEDSGDLAQSTSFQQILQDIGSEDDECGSGIMSLYNPSSSVFVKHFMAETSRVWSAPGEGHQFIAGYFNTTNPIDAIQFKMESGNIDSGDICLYGIA